MRFATKHVRRERSNADVRLVGDSSGEILRDPNDGVRYSDCSIQIDTVWPPVVGMMKPAVRSQQREVLSPFIINVASFTARAYADGRR